MAIPLLEVSPKTQNQRVPGYEVIDEDDPLAYRLTPNTPDSSIDAIIWAAYRQIFSEQLILESNRQTALESQLRNRAISVREFVRGLGKSDVYRTLVADTNSNYRLVDLTFKRFLGRATYSRDEQIAWSIVIATKGLHGFIDAVVNSDEYQQNFGDTIVPYQRRRYEGRPFNLVNPRYGDYWRNRLYERAGGSYFTARPYRPGELDRTVIRQAIPGNFLSMARKISIGEMNYQRDTARAQAIASSVSLPETTSQATIPPASVKPPAVALPYRYLPGTPKA